MCQPNSIAEELETTPISTALPAATPLPPSDKTSKHTPGGSRELLKLAFPLIVSQSFMTVQVFLDAILLSWHNPKEMAASFPAVMWYWLMYGALQVIASYTYAFVAQYTGANRPHRVGPAVWQGIHFSLLIGVLFLVVYPLAPTFIAISGHAAEIQPLEVKYLQCLSFAALPMMVMAAVNGFFSGRGYTWTVFAIEASGTVANICLALVLIFGENGVPKIGLPGIPGLPAMGIEGAGWATVVGSYVSAFTALVLFLRPSNRVAFNTLGGWKPERELFRRLLRFGGPAGLQIFLDIVVFHLFTLYVGRLGEAELGATTLTVRFNMIAFLPMMGLGHAVSVLVGQRLGGNQPELAEKSAYTGLKWTFGYMLIIASMYLTIPHVLVSMFSGDADPQAFEAMAAIVPSLLTCVAIYSVTDAINVTFSFALRGAGDTKYVTKWTFALAWPILVLPTMAVVTFREELHAQFPRMGDPVYWAWSFATLHIIAMSICFWFRFRSGKWKTMRVIEPLPGEAEPAAP